ncbi:MAG TPA: hypothetical protein VED41_12825, partial [Solirubrobacteraceae bacterium]|nr:hypothetical protein [Solirubrobacteraceae bacterium]
MAADARQAPALFDPSSFARFRFLSRELDARGGVTLRYALDERVEFVETFALPLGGGGRELSAGERRRVDGLLALAHWVAGVSYFKTALPSEVSCETGPPPAAVAELLEALYSEGLGELAYVNGLDALPCPRFPRAPAGGPWARELPRSGRVLVPVGGGKDSAVALEIVRRACAEPALFSV